jgi:hypothetical protein
VSVVVKAAEVEAAAQHRGVLGGFFPSETYLVLTPILC